MKAPKKEQGDRHERVKELFFAASELSPADRRVFLDERCANDPALRSEIDSLLHYHEKMRARARKPVV